MFEEKNTLLSLKVSKSSVIWLLLICLLFATFGCKERTTILSSTASVCAHYNNASATIIQLTDQYYPPDHHMVRDDDRKYGAAWAEFLAFQYNIPLHVFERSVKGNEFEDFLETGRGGASIYYPSCVDKFDEDTFESIRDNIEDVYEKTITTLSYGCGKTTYMTQLPKDILGGRNSLYDTDGLHHDAITWYGNNLGNAGAIDFSENNTILSRAASGRYYAMLQKENKSVQEVAKHVISEVQKTMHNKGFYTNFMHWDDWYKNSNDSLIKGLEVIEPLFSAMQIGIKNNGKNSGLDYNEAIEYLYAKEAVDSIEVTYYSNKTLGIDVWKSEKRDRDYSRIDTPVTIAISEEILKQVGNFNPSYSTQLVSAFFKDKQLLLNVRLNFEKKFESITIDLDGSNQVHNLDTPLAITATQTETVIASEEVKFVLFRRKKGDKNYKLEIVERTTSFSENYDIPRLEKGYHYFCGAIDRKRESTILEL